MKTGCLCVTLFIYLVNCEWVEITPIVNKKPIKEWKHDTTEATTSSNYEVLMKTPSLTNDLVFTTPTYNWEQNSGDDNYTITESTNSDTLPNSSSYSTTEELWKDQDDENHLDDGDEGFLPFLRMIQNELIKYKSSKSKMSILKHLRDHLIVNIKNHFLNLWKPIGSSFEARGYKEEESHMDFPSNEGALMTIGFLTFAVFLIKLVI
ncbi:hypothetical protein NQ317_010713, partial [Molorchus minor]